MYKQEADYLNKISVYWLKEHGYFDRSKKGKIVWVEQNNDISIETNLEEMYLRIFYYINKRTDWKETEEIEYKVPLTTTECNFGGERYWFECPLYKDKERCGKRVGVLYSGGKYFGCRHCYDLTYESKNRSSGTVAFEILDLFQEARELEQEITTKFYDGKPTKKYKKLLKLYSKINYYNSMLD